MSRYWLRYWKTVQVGLSWRSFCFSFLCTTWNDLVVVKPMFSLFLVWLAAVVLSTEAGRTNCMVSVCQCPSGPWARWSPCSPEPQPAASSSAYRLQTLFLKQTQMSEWHFKVQGGYYYRPRNNFLNDLTLSRQSTAMTLEYHGPAKKKKVKNICDIIMQ